MNIGKFIAKNHSRIILLMKNQERLMLQI